MGRGADTVERKWSDEEISKADHVVAGVAAWILEGRRGGREPGADQVLQGFEEGERQERMKESAISFQRSAVKLWRERWNVVMGGGLFGVLVLIVKLLEK